MFNYGNLNDVEFEYLCKDIMTRKLGVSLERFAPGKDGGIDLTNNVCTKSVIVQVKHYIKTDFNGLLSSLKKEVVKVNKNQPGQYYICCSKELTPSNKADIYDLFSEYMNSTQNIISLIDIDDFLQKEENFDILKRHFKLWIESTNILTDIFTNDICIDCDALLSDIEDDEKIFVKTDAYEKAINYLEKNNVLMIIGDPGVGKTTLSKMLILSYATQGYHIRYTTDGTNLSNLKKSLSKSSDIKEIILLDDCFGQAYFNMKETQGNELLYLIKYVRNNTKKRLILNSRVTIYQDANYKNEQLVKSFERKEYKLFILDMNCLQPIEKAKILYNHLYFNDVPTEYLDQIKINKNYWKIINHPNYNPRIIEYICNLRHIESVRPNNYMNFILKCLNNPEQVWKNEFENRLSYVDRALLTTLYSLTNTTISKGLLKKCFNSRIKLFTGLDTTINHFAQSLFRLQKSFIKVVDEKGECKLSVINPSVNDFLKSHIEQNDPEKSALLSSCVTVMQLKRLLTEHDFDAKISEIFNDKSILQYEFESKQQKNAFITYYVSYNNILDEDYELYFENYITNVCDVDLYDNSTVSACKVIKCIFNKEIFNFYEIRNYINDADVLQNLLEQFDLDEIVKVINDIDWMFDGKDRESYIEVIIQVLEDTVQWFCDNISADDYDLDIGSIIDEYSLRDKYGNVYEDRLIREIECIIEDKVVDEIYDYLIDLPADIKKSQDFIDKSNIYVNGCDTLVESFLSADYDYKDFHERSFYVNSEIDYIFER